MSTSSRNATKKVPDREAAAAPLAQADLPVDTLLVAKKASRRPVVGQRGRPYDTCRALADGSPAPSAHLGRHPAGAYCIDQDAAALQLGRDDSRQPVERRLRGRVRGSARAHRRNRARATRDVDDPTPAAQAHQRYAGANQPPGAKNVGLERFAHDALDIRGDRGLPGIVVNGGVVDQRVERTELSPDALHEFFDVRRIRHVQRRGYYASAMVALDFPRGGLTLGEVTRAQ